ncbi:hypothetical protein DNH61_04880 [Paenibacillus sambharensis]|uniref:CN hydrolase domain-containing protein n=1 Tax=Paenibacillus sambharensis TaxID=1803190 RepID=A0A2W1LR39_9BACL|nr:hypothetical protein [Paenibacillus sambharensis]PZD96984.1 hypothetical protein DNH61_04880 [Paenibacillus sambharensis]
MKILICQPKLEPKLRQLHHELIAHPGIDAVIVPEGYMNENVEEACQLAHEFKVAIIGGYRRMQERPKDRAIAIDREGRIVLDRIKYSDTAFANVDGWRVGHILCDELIQQGLRTEDQRSADLIVHPIGVGMFSEAQFDEWIDKARAIAAERGCYMIGVSHADGSYGDTGVSISIAYCFNRQGETVFIARGEAGSRVVELELGG